jgi:hypothetical protein
MNMKQKILVLVWALALPPLAKAGPPAPTVAPLVRTADLNVVETQVVELSGGKKVAVKLLDVKEVRDELRNAVRKAGATVEVAGAKVTLVSGNYHLPIGVE